MIGIMVFGVYIRSPYLKLPCVGVSYGLLVTTGTTTRVQPLCNLACNHPFQVKTWGDANHTKTI